MAFLRRGSLQARPYRALMTSAAILVGAGGVNAARSSTTLPGNGDGIRCPSGVVRIAEVQAFIQSAAQQERTKVIGSASLEVCADNETKYIDIITSGAPDDVANNGQQGQKTGIDGSIQIHGRTARLNTNIYIPLTESDLSQCARQEDAQPDGACKPHAQVASFTGTWVFSLGKWTMFRTGADTAGGSVVVAARILNGPVE